MVSEIGYKKRILHNAINPPCQSVWIVMKVCSKINQPWTKEKKVRLTFAVCLLS